MTDGLKEAYKDANSKFRLAGEPVMITCCKCHGEGTFRVPILDDNGEWGYEWESRQCELCHGTGKITLEFYEKLQKGCRK